MKINYWADITGNALSALDSLAELGLTPESLNTEIERALRAYAVEMGYHGVEEEEDETDYYRLAVEMRHEAAAELLQK